MLPILQWPDPVLATPCAPVQDPTALKRLVADMFETMYDAPGRGLAAPQVGVLQRVFVMDVTWKDGDRTPLACINPQILSASDAQVSYAEACLSAPGVSADLDRPAEILLGYTDPDGAAQRLALTGAAARVAQHELDHLDGIMHFDRLDPAARDALIAQFRALP